MRYKEISLKQIDELIEKYLDKGGEYYELQEGSLGYGTVALYNLGNDKLSNFIIQEYYINAWSSGHKIYRYNKELPKKYMEQIENKS